MVSVKERRTGEGGEGVVEREVIRLHLVSFVGELERGKPRAIYQRASERGISLSSLARCLVL